MQIVKTGSELVGSGHTAIDALAKKCRFRVHAGAVAAICPTRHGPTIRAETKIAPLASALARRGLPQAEAATAATRLAAAKSVEKVGEAIRRLCGDSAGRAAGYAASGLEGARAAGWAYNVPYRSGAGRLRGFYLRGLAISA